jgi:phospholipid/cholesterol/gamma-HCH transport system permease protein
MAPVAANLVTSQAPGVFVLSASGEWLVATAADLDQKLRALKIPAETQVTLDVAGIDRLDTAGAWLLLRTEQALVERGNAVEMRNLRPNLEPLIEQVRAAGKIAPAPHPRPAHHTIAGFIARIGEVSLALIARAYSILGFFGITSATALRLILHPRRLRMTAVIAQMEQTGVNALPIVGLLTFLIGVVIAFQGADYLKFYGLESYTVQLTGASILRELGVLLTAIIIAGRTGSAFTAQIGTMRVNQEIDAMLTIGLDPVEVLVLPRLFAMLLTLPMLTLYANFMGVFGGGLMAWAELGIGIPQFLDRLSTLAPWSFWIGMIKSPFFAIVIALIGCYEGFQVSGSAESVGRLTTLSVVEAIFLVIVIDAGFSIFFSALQI